MNNYKANNKLLISLKIISIFIFLIIARNNPHVTVPMIFVLVTSLIYMLTELEHVIIPLLAFIGLLIILYSLINKRVILVILGYLLTYVILGSMLLDKSFYERIDKEIYFIITFLFYMILSIYIIIKTIKNSNHKNIT